MKYLLDNDAFLAAICLGHPNNKTVRAWLDQAKPSGWGIAVETYLAAVRLMMNPAVMQQHVRKVDQALDAVDAELSGKHPGRIVYASEKPNRTMLAKAQGHKQVMDIWLVQIARQEGCKLATNDAGTLVNWPADTVSISS
ncbi:VapC toxin family PIN domain ribonuclease [Opitutaceae bacterium TAV4]|nr:VapC toxin family PIN domain ribonuclease [Opitutaceae bacterium TAV4]RRJ99068.1 VapC toxin family PIN domain ribonuclease [Opitutaceae bacterium TAV3]